jgi:hypothetical protein
VATSGATLANRLGAASLPQNMLRLADVRIPAGASSVSEVRDRRPWARGLNWQSLNIRSGNITPPTVTKSNAGMPAARVELSGAPLEVLWQGRISPAASAGTWVGIYPRLDGVIPAEFGDGTQPGPISAFNPGFNGAWLLRWIPTPGSYLLDFVSWASTAGGSIRMDSGDPLNITVREVLRGNQHNGTS